jgi:hypothetical protein
MPGSGSSASAKLKSEALEKNVSGNARSPKLVGANRVAVLPAVATESPLTAMALDRWENESDRSGGDDCESLNARIRARAPLERRLERLHDRPDSNRIQRLESADGDHELTPVGSVPDSSEPFSFAIALEVQRHAENDELNSPAGQLHADWILDLFRRQRAHGRNCRTVRAVRAWSSGHVAELVLVLVLVLQLRFRVLAKNGVRERRTPGRERDQPTGRRRLHLVAPARCHGFSVPHQRTARSAPFFPHVPEAKKRRCKRVRSRAGRASPREDPERPVAGVEDAPC